MKNGCFSWLMNEVDDLFYYIVITKAGLFASERRELAIVSYNVIS